MPLQAVPRPCLPSAASSSSVSSMSDTSTNRLSDYSDSGTSSDGTEWSASYRHGPSRQSSATSLSSISSCTCSFRRPLPRVPTNVHRPLPAVPLRSRSDSAPHRPVPIRPLPSPKTCARTQQNLRSPPMRTDSLHALPSKRKALSPKVNLILDFTSSDSTLELVLESPVHPLTPITFDVDESDIQRRTQEDELAIRLTAFGFVEVSEEADTSQRIGDEDVVILMEGESKEKGGLFAKRCSRKWVREKKGKRWIEDDYKRVLEVLRKL